MEGKKLRHDEIRKKMLLFSLNLTLLRTSMASFCGFWLVVMALWFLDALFGFLSLPFSTSKCCAT